MTTRTVPGELAAYHMTGRIELLTPLRRRLEASTHHADALALCLIEMLTAARAQLDEAQLDLHEISDRSDDAENHCDGVLRTLGEARDDLAEIIAGRRRVRRLTRSERRAAHKAAQLDAAPDESSWCASCEARYLGDACDGCEETS